MEACIGSGHLLMLLNKGHILNQLLIPLPSHHSDWIYMMNSQVPKQLGPPKHLQSL